MSTERETIAVIGTGYVGLVTAAGFAELGSQVWCVDVDADKIARLQAGDIPIWEPGLAECVRRNRERMHFTTDLAPALEHARLLFVAVGTPPTYSGDADLSAVHAVVDAMPASDRHALVMKSTVPVGTGASIERAFAERGKGFRYVSCPEFLKEGSALQDFLHPDRVVVGDRGDWAGDAVVELYAPLDAPLVRTDVASAEMVKLASNAFLATKISFINEIANVCEETGADVLEVARGMGLDQRIGNAFLRPGIGFGGSCLTGDETVLARRRGRTTLMRLDALWEETSAREDEVVQGLIEPDGLEVLSWLPDRPEPLFLEVACLTRRDYEGEILTVHTKMGRRLRCTPDHPWVVRDGHGETEPRVELAESLTTDDWAPVVQGRADHRPVGAGTLSLLVAAEICRVPPEKIRVRPPVAALDGLLARHAADRAEVFAHPRGWSARQGDVRRSGTMTLAEAGRGDVPIAGATVGTAKNGSYFSSLIATDERFWRVVGLYLAEGNSYFDARGKGSWRVSWSFHPRNEEHLVDEVCALWLRHGVSPRVLTTPTSRIVTVSSRLFGAWWTETLGLGRNSYEQRIPDFAWDLPVERKWALLSGLFEGDGSWSLINGGPSVIIELGTVSDELADGTMRLLGDLGVVASWRRGRAAKSTKETHWLRITGADQVERAIALVPERDRLGVLTSISRQRKRIAPTGYRTMGDGPAWARITRIDRTEFSGPVFSMEVPHAHTFVSTGGLTLDNCFPKDVSALKQLAGNSGYHFQLLTSVIEVNELQKRRVVQKLQKHLGTLVGKKIALLGLAFKPNTDDMREASSLVLAARLQADGAQVAAYDPVAEEEARKLIQGVRFAEGALDALEGADAAVVVTEWPEFREVDWRLAAERMAGRLVVDGRNCLDADEVRAAGFTYEGVGRGA